MAPVVADLPARAPAFVLSVIEYVTGILWWWRRWWGPGSPEGTPQHLTDPLQKAGAAGSLTSTAGVQVTLGTTGSLQLLQVRSRHCIPGFRVSLQAFYIELSSAPCKESRGPQTA